MARQRCPWNIQRVAVATTSVPERTSGEQVSGLRCSWTCPPARVNVRYGVNNGSKNSTSRSYGAVGIEDTYYLAFREVARLLRELGVGHNALDHGCGSGRSTRFLRDWGFRAIGIDVDAGVLGAAKDRDPAGMYVRADGCALPFGNRSFDLVFQSFVFVEYRRKQNILTTLREFRRVLRAGGTAIVVTASEEYYSREWKSFRPSKSSMALTSGEQVAVELRGTDVVFNDTYWSSSDYEELFRNAGFAAALTLAFGYSSEPFNWVSEKDFSCWSVYMLTGARGCGERHE